VPRSAYLRQRHGVWLAAAGLLALGCVSQGKYDAALTDAARARELAAKERLESAQLQTASAAELARLRADLAARQASEGATARQLAERQAHDETCSKALDQAVAMASSFRSELARMGKDVDELLAAKGVLTSSLEQASRRLEELRRAQAAADARAHLLRDIAYRLKRMVDSGDLRIVLRSGRMVLALPNDVLFDSGKAEVKRRGKETLSAIAAVLSTLPQRRFQVAGHSDDQPIRQAAFASNWELSAARGLAVLAILIESGMRPEALSAAGYGEFDPAQPNDSPEHRTLNRRIEIVLQPNIDELVSVPAG
jgi:chemotaxis protein MotB